MCAYPVLRTGASHGSALTLAAVQALLPAWLELTDSEIPTPALNDHLRLASAGHHNPLAMAALNFLAGLALVHVFRSVSGFRRGGPTRRTPGSASPARPG